MINFIKKNDYLINVIFDVTYLKNYRINAKLSF